jgi:chemotaxis protein CheC
MNTPLSDTALDGLRELCSMGAGHAVGALSRLLGGQAVLLQVPRAVPLRRSALAAELGPGQWVAVEFHVQGEAAGLLVLLLPEAAASAMAAALLGRPPGPLGALEQDALCEVGNILASSFLDTWARVTGLWLQPSVPRWLMGTAEAAVMGLRYGDGDEPGVVLEAQWMARGNPALHGRLLLLPDAGTVTSLLAGLGLGAG